MKVIFDDAMNETFFRTRYPTQKIDFDMKNAESDLIAQLGEKWSEFQNLSGKRKKALRQLWTRMERKTQQESRLIDFLEPVDDGPLAKCLEDHARRHAYEATVLLAFIHSVKNSSAIIASSDFQWLRKSDYQMWLLINNYGRPRQHPKIVGAFTHYALECELKRPITKTFFDNATLHMTGQVPIALSNQKKRGES